MFFHPVKCSYAWDNYGYGSRLKSSVIKLIKIFAAFTEHRHVNTRSMQIYYHNSAIVGSSDIPRKLQCFFTKCANKASIKIVHIPRVVQYTGTDSTGVIVCSFSHDSYGSWNNGWRVLQLLKSTTRTGRETIVYKSFSWWTCSSETVRQVNYCFTTRIRVVFSHSRVVSVRRYWTRM